MVMSSLLILPVREMKWKNVYSVHRAVPHRINGITRCSPSGNALGNLGSLSNDIATARRRRAWERREVSKGTSKYRNS